MSTKHRRKSQLVLIKNDCLNEEPIVVTTNTEPDVDIKKKEDVIVLFSSSDTDGIPKTPKKKTKKNVKKTKERQDSLTEPSEVKIILTDILATSPFTPEKKSHTKNVNQNTSCSDDDFERKKGTKKKFPAKAIQQLQQSNVDKENTPTESESPATGVRRSTRKVKLSLKAIEGLELNNTPTKQWRKKRDDTTSSSESETELNNTIEKSNVLFEMNDVAGKSMFGFQTPKKRNALLNKVAELTDSATGQPKTNSSKKGPKTPNTPRTLLPKTSCNQIPKTPAAVRCKLKKNLNHMVRELEGSDLSDFSGTDSDYVQEGDSSSSSSSDSDEVPSDSEDKKKTPLPVAKHTLSTRKSTRLTKDVTYNLCSDDYFTMHGTSKAVTSDHTLDQLNNPRFSQETLNELLTNMKLSTEHEKSISDLANDCHDLFKKWLYLLYEGFNVVLYGIGSKRNLLQSFHHELSNQSNFPVIVVNGFFPSLVVKDIVDAVLDDLLESKETHSSVYDAVDFINSEFRANPEMHVFLIVHNIDGEMLRSSKTQNILSKLAAVPNIHLLASLDHINAPLIWDHAKLSRFNFTWWDATTFLPYTHETSFESSMLVQRSGSLTLSSLKNIFQSLTTNARGIYTIIIKSQMEHKKSPHYLGISFKDLYWQCREAFLVSSDVALRAQLTEFHDHHLIKTKRNFDGAELLHIPIESSLLQHFLDQE